MAEFYAHELDPGFRERGCERCSDAAAISDALYREDGRRAVVDAPPITLRQARDELFAGAEMVTYRVREKGDPVGGETCPPCISCALLGRYFGFELLPPSADQEESAHG